MGVKWTIVAAFLVLIGGRAAAQDVLIGMPADEYWRHKHEFAELMPKAMAGDPVAQDRIGAFYDYGFVDQDYSLAALWYRRAAKQGNADAQYNLAALYFFGRGVAADEDEGLTLLRAAAAQGHMLAERSLGEALIYGWFGLKVDDQQGWKLIFDAAKAGNIHAQALWATRKDSPERRAWLERAARFADPDALSALAFGADEELKRAGGLLAVAQAGDTSAMIAIACTGLETSQSDHERRVGLRWLGLAIDGGNPNAILAIWSLDARHLIKLSPVQRAFLPVVLYDQQTRLSPDIDEQRTRIPYFVSALFNLPPNLREQVRQLRSDHWQRKITFDDWQLAPDPAAPSQDWTKSCELMKKNK